MKEYPQDDGMFGTKAFVILIGLLVAGIVIILVVNNCFPHKNSVKKNAYESSYTNYDEYTVGTFVLKESFKIPNYASKSLCKVVDTSLNIVCYINAVGGGIKCFKLDSEGNILKDSLPIKKVVE